VVFGSELGIPSLLILDLVTFKHKPMIYLYRAIDGTPTKKAVEHNAIKPSEKTRYALENTGVVYVTVMASSLFP
jgi:hypothetical protein